MLYAAAENLFRLWVAKHDSLIEGLGRPISVLRVCLWPIETGRH